MRWHLLEHWIWIWFCNMYHRCICQPLTWMNQLQAMYRRLKTVNVHRVLNAQQKIYTEIIPKKIGDNWQFLSAVVIMHSVHSTPNLRQGIYPLGLLARCPSLCSFGACIYLYQISTSNKNNWTQYYLDLQDWVFLIGTIVVTCRLNWTTIRFEIISIRYLNPFQILWFYLGR